MAIEIIGQDPGLVITNNIASQINLNLSAPQSIWEKLVSDDSYVRAMIDLSGLQPGKYDIPVQVQIGIRPVKIVSYSPQTISLSLENISSRNMAVRLVQSGELAVGFEAQSPTLNVSHVSVTGPESLIRQVSEIRALLDVGGINKSISRAVK